MVDVSAVIAAEQQLGMVNAQNRAWALQERQRRASQFGALAGLGVGAATFAATGSPTAGAFAGQGASMLVTPAMGGQAPDAAQIGQLGLNAYMAQQQAQKQQANTDVGNALLQSQPQPAAPQTPATMPGAPNAQGSNAGAGLESMIPGAYSAPSQGPPSPVPALMGNQLPPQQGAFGNIAQASTPQYASSQDAAKAGAFASLQKAIASGTMDPKDVASILGVINPPSSVVQTAAGATTSLVNPRTGQVQTIVEGGQSPQMARVAATTRGQYLTENKPYQAIIPYAKNLQQIASNPNPTGADDYSLAYNVQKMLNPTSQVSPNEADGLKTVGSFDQRLQQYVGQLATGNKFTDAQRHDLIQVGQRHFEGMDTQYQLSRQNFTKIAENNKWNPEDVAPSLNDQVNPKDLQSYVDKMPGAPKPVAPPDPKIQQTAEKKLVQNARIARSPAATARQQSYQAMSSQELQAVNYGRLTPSQKLALDMELKRRGY